MLLCLLSYFFPHVYFSLPTLTEYTLGFQGTTKCLQHKSLYGLSGGTCTCFRENSSAPRNALLRNKGRGHTEEESPRPLPGVRYSARIREHSVGPS